MLVHFSKYCLDKGSTATVPPVREDFILEGKKDACTQAGGLVLDSWCDDVRPVPTALDYDSLINIYHGYY
jgi:hypothetical protein